MSTDKLQSSVAKSENGYILRCYNTLVICTLFIHVFYFFTFLALQIDPLVYYNVFSCAFYVVVLYLIDKGYIWVALTSIHFEVAAFAVLTTIGLGWECGFQFYLITMLTLVYFCPFRNKYVPYIFSIFESVLFVAMRLVTINHPVIFLDLPEQVEYLLYIINAVCAIAAIIFSSILFNISTAITRRTLFMAANDLENIANFDHLTGLMLRRPTIELIESLWDERGEKDDACFTVCMADIDNFKRINDTYGHDGGDYVLYTVSRILKNSRADVCRWGGEEFILVFDGDKAKIRSEVTKLCSEISSYPFSFAGHDFSVTVTIGVCESTDAVSYQEMITLADAHMYQGKTNGKNCVIA